MGRSVSYATGAAATVFMSFAELYAPDEESYDPKEHDGRTYEEERDFWYRFGQQDDWDHFVGYDLPSVMQERYPSFETCDDWIEREVHAILENGHAYVTVSEYCGFVSVCLVPKAGRHAGRYADERDEALARAWTQRTAENWKDLMIQRYPAMWKQGSMSNGVGVYRRYDTRGKALANALATA